jgi:hypothetical protein
MELPSPSIGFGASDALKVRLTSSVEDVYSQSRGSCYLLPSRIYPPNPTDLTAKSTPGAFRTIVNVSSLGSPLISIRRS